LAEKPPRVVERNRAHGDIVDKAYSTVARGGGSMSAGTPAQARAQRPQAPIDRGASRINCSDSGVDCAASHGKAAAGGRGGDAGAHGGSRIERPPAILDKLLGSDRTNFNEAGEDQGMSLRAAKRAWERASGAHGHGSAGAELPLSSKQQVDRHS